MNYNAFGEDDHFFQIVLNINDEFGREGTDERYYRHEIYIDGKKEFSGGYNIKAWNDFIDNSIKNLNTFFIGRVVMSAYDSWHYIKMQTYALRLYSRGLTETEVMENYKSSVVYHNFIEKLNK